MLIMTSGFDSKQIAVLTVIPVGDLESWASLHAEPYLLHVSHNEDSSFLFRS